MVGPRIGPAARRSDGTRVPGTLGPSRRRALPPRRTRSVTPSRMRCCCVNCVVCASFEAASCSAQHQSDKTPPRHAPGRLSSSHIFLPHYTRMLFSVYLHRRGTRPGAYTSYTHRALRPVGAPCSYAVYCRRPLRRGRRSKGESRGRGRSACPGGGGCGGGGACVGGHRRVDAR